MADLTAPAATRSKSPGGDRAARQDEPIWDIIELLFFAYRDFVSEPDDVLAKFGFGRAHHRVLHFVNRNPGMKVAELLDILKITKQSLGRVLEQLVAEGYVIQKEGASDRRQRLLYVTSKGETLAMKLAGLQTARIAGALDELGPNAHEAARRFLVTLIDPDNRDGVLRFIARADRVGDEHLQDAVADLDRHVRHQVGTLDPGAADLGAVEAAEVAQQQAARRPLDDAVEAGDRGIGDAQMIARRLADANLFLVDQPTRAAGGARHNRQSVNLVGATVRSPHVSTCRAVGLDVQVCHLNFG
jgi:DNA-binding MarR family transcriptional regulator